VVREPWEESDKDGTVRLATIRTYGDTTHTLVDRSRYKGWFMPSFQQRSTNDPVLQMLYVSLHDVARNSWRITAQQNGHMQ